MKIIEDKKLILLKDGSKGPKLKSKHEKSIMLVNLFKAILEKAHRRIFKKDFENVLAQKYF